MTHQLVIQFKAKTLEDFDKLIGLYEPIERAIKPGAHLDGHDSGSGGFNFFIHTDEPEVIFNRTAELIASIHPGLTFSAGCRAFNEDEYKSLWPLSATNFSIL